MTAPAAAKVWRPWSRERPVAIGATMDRTKGHRYQNRVGGGFLCPRDRIAHFVNARRGIFAAMNQKEKILYTNWLEILNENRDSLKQMTLVLRRESAEALQCILLQDKEVLRLKEPVHTAWCFLKSLSPSETSQPHQVLAQVVTSALAVGEYEGWEQRGYQTTSLQLITASLFIEKVLLSLYEAQAWNSPAELASNWWLRMILGVKP
jgi:hypothetical protein